MKEYIVKYYLSEVHGATVNIIVGIILVIVAIVLWRVGTTHGLNRGLAYALLGGGLFSRSYASELLFTTNKW